MGFKGLPVFPASSHNHNPFVPRSKHRIYTLYRLFRIAGDHFINQQPPKLLFYNIPDITTQTCGINKSTKQTASDIQILIRTMNGCCLLFQKPAAMARLWDNGPQGTDMQKPPNPSYTRTRNPDIQSAKNSSRNIGVIIEVAEVLVYVVVSSIHWQDYGQRGGLIVL